MMRLQHSILFVSIGFLSLAQAKKEVKLAIEPADVETGESFVLTVESTVQGEIEIDNLPGSFTYGAGTSQQMFQRMDYNTGEIINYFRISQVGVIDKAGTYTIGPAYIKTGQKAYPSNKVRITVGNQVPMTSGALTNAQFNSPAFGVIQTNKTTVYEGEPVLISAKIYSRFSPSDFTNYNSYLNSQSIESHSLSQNNTFRLKREKLRGSEFYSFEYDKQVAFPIGAGSMHIDPFTMDLLRGFDGFRILSAGSSIKVKPLPSNPPNDFIGTVGEYTITRTIDTLVVKQGELFRMLITVEGHGNLQNAMQPKLQLPKGFIVYGDPVITENLAFGSLGAQGSIIYEYNIQVTSDGKIKFPGTTISYFDPEKEKYVQAVSDEHEFEIIPNKKFQGATASNDDNDAEVSPNLYKLRTKQNVLEASSFYGSGLFWTGVSAPILSSLFFLLFMRRREREEESIQEREKVRKKAQSTNEYLTIAEQKLTGEADEFYSNVEFALKSAFTIPLRIDNVGAISKTNIVDYLKQHENSSLQAKVNRLFRICEETRFGMGEGQNSREDILAVLKEVCAAVQE